VDQLALPDWIGDVAPVAVPLVMLFVSLLRGWLVPGRTVDRLLVEKQGMIDLLTAAVSRWEAVADAQRTRAETAEAQNGTLLAGMDTQTQLLRSIQQEAARRRTGS
jgi:hypothetical protein